MVGQRSQEHRLYHAEHGRVRADSQRQGANCEDGKSRSLNQLSEGAAEVLRESGEHTIGLTRESLSIERSGQVICSAGRGNNMLAGPTPVARAGPSKVDLLRLFHRL